MNQPAHPRTIDRAPARFTAEEFTEMAAMGAFADMKVELIDGELQRVNPPLSDHGNRQMRVGIKLWQAVRDDTRIVGDTAIRLDDDTVVACDVALLYAAVDRNRSLIPADVLLVIEISETTLNRDTGIKRQKYAIAGIAHYWVVDGPRGVVHVYGQPVAGDYAQIATVRFGDPLPVPGTGASITL